MSKSDLKKAQEQLERRRQQLGEQEDGDWKERLDKARQAQKKAQATGSSGESKQPEAKAPKVQSTNKAGPHDQSIADVRLENFRQANGKLSQSKTLLPNLAVQTRIFPPTKKGRRPIFDWKYIESNRNDIEIWQRGEQLNQLDLTGWIVIIKFAGEDLVARFTRYEFLKAMRRHDSSRDYRWLRAFLNRIGFTQFAIYLHQEDQKWERYAGALAPQDYERSDGLHAVQLSKPLYALFGFDGWSFVNLDQRLALGQNQWAQAFHAWSSTNICPNNGFWWKKEDLWREWGAEYRNLENFMRQFRRRVLKPLYDIEFVKKVEEKKTAIGLWW
jgi:hypothetical protein